MSNIRYEDVPLLSPPPTVAATPPPPTVAPTQSLSQPIPQPGTPLVDTSPGVFIPAPLVVQATTATPSVPSTQGQPIPQPGRPLVDTSTGVFIPAPPAETAGGGGSGQTPSLADESELPDLEGLDFFGNPPLKGAAFVQYVRRGSESRNFDDLAVFANAIVEGLHGGMGDSGTSFGPWNMHQGGKLPKKYWGYPAFSPLVQAWTWTPQGIDWALNLMGKEGVGGLRGHASVHRIVEQFEIPSNIPGQEVVRDDIYDQLAKMGDPYSFLAAQAAGPSISGVTTGTAKKGASGGAIGASGRWRDIIDAFGKDLPKLRENILAHNERLREAFK